MTVGRPTVSGAFGIVADIRRRLAAVLVFSLPTVATVRWLRLFVVVAASGLALLRIVLLVLAECRPHQHAASEDYENKEQ